MMDPEQARLGYAICSVGRSGSSWFGELLRTTGELGDPREFFNTKYQRRLYGADYPGNRREQVRLILSEGASRNGVYGLKVFPIHLDGVARHVGWTRGLPHLHFVYWKRRDVLGQALSRLRALQTEQWRSTLTTTVTAEYDGAWICSAMRWILTQDARWELYFARNGIAPLRLTYEDAMQAVQPTVDALSAFLELETRPQVDPAKTDLAVQRDATTDAWRARFLEEFGDLDDIDVL